MKRTIVTGILCVFTAVVLGACAAAPAPPASTAVPAFTLAPTAVPSPTAVPLPPAEPSPTASLVPTVPPTAQPAGAEIQVYFTDRNRFNAGTLPFEVAVPRTAPAGAVLPEAVLAEFFKGPTEAEQAQGLEALTSGFTGYSSLKVQGGVAHVYLVGPCASNGASYNVASLIVKNLRQFPQIQYVKIYDADGVTGEPEGATTSIPPCLEP